MALFVYQALAKDGKRKSGSLDAPSEQAVKEALARLGLYPISIELAKEASQRFSFRQLLEGSVTAKEKILFTKQLAVLLKSGIPLLQSLELLTEQFDGRMKRIVVALKDNLKEGGTLAQGLSNYPKIFENIYVQLVRAGEASGKLDFILERLTKYLERREELHKRIGSAMRPALIQLGIIGLVTIILLAFVMPKLEGMFSGVGRKLPTVTRVVVAISNALTNHYVIILATVILIVMLYLYWANTHTGKKTIDTIKLKLPLIGYFAKTRAVAEFCSTLGMLLEAGVNLAEALDIVCNIVDNQILADTLQEARDKIVKEGKIAQYLKQTKIFPPMAIYLIKTGEETGQLDQMLLLVTKNYESDLTELTDTLTDQLQPFMLIATALIVGVIVMAIALPLMNMSSALTGM